MKGFAQALLGGPVWVDARVQRLVNAGMFAVMRRGVRKSTIRRTMWRAALCAFCATIAAYLFNGERHSFWVYVIASALPASLAWTGRLERWRCAACQKAQFKTQKAWYTARFAAGICDSCPGARRPAARNCEACQKKRAEKRRVRRRSTA